MRWNEITEAVTMKLYHGTPHEFDEFDPTKSAPGGAYGAGFYFSNDVGLGRQYSDRKDPMVCTVTLKNPWIVDLDLPHSDPTHNEQKQVFRTKGARERLIDAGFDGVIVKQGRYREVIAYDPQAIQNHGRGKTLRESADKWIKVYHGHQDPVSADHEWKFFTTDPLFAEQYGSVTEYQIRLGHCLDTTDRDIVENFILPIQHPLFDEEFTTWSEYSEWRGETWEIVEENLDDILARYPVHVDSVKVTEQGCVNYMVRDPRNMRVVQRPLTEAPIAAHHIVGKPDDYHPSFGEADRKILKSPKAIQKIYRAFQKTPHVFEVFFVHSDVAAGDHEEDNGMVDDLARSQQAGVHDAVDDIKGKPGVIRVVLLSNLSPLEAKMPLTGWTLAHKLGHAFQDECYNSGWRTALAEPVKKILGWLHQIATKAGGPHVGSDTTWFHMHPHLTSMMTMKSARTGKLRNDFEIFAEAIAQYLVTGRCTLKGADPEYEQSLNQAIRDLFDTVTGKVLLEV